MTRSYSPPSMTSAAKRQASFATASDSLMSALSQVNPSPSAHQSTPRLRPIFSSPTFQSPDLRNCTTDTFHPRATARSIVPNAAVDFPFPSPVLTMTSEGSRSVPGSGGDVGGSASGIRVPWRSHRTTSFHVPGLLGNRRRGSG